MESNEPPFIKYEEILVEDDEIESKIDASEEGTLDESSEEEMEEDKEPEDEENLLSSITTADKDHTESVRNETISRILDFVFAPRKIEKNGKKYILQLSRKAATRSDVIELTETFEKYLKDRQVRMQGFCPVRRELYDLLFDELIRQATINCPERRSLLLRVRDEFRMTMTAHERLLESGVEFGSRKALEAEIEERKIEAEYKQLQDEVARAEKHIKDLKAEIEAEEMQSKQRLDMKQARHEEKMQFLEKLNKQLKEQISIIT